MLTLSKEFTMSTKYQRLAAAHTLSLPQQLRNTRSPWRAFTIATRLVAAPMSGSAFGAGVELAFSQMFDPAARFVPVYNKHPRRSHIVRQAA